MARLVAIALKPEAGKPMVETDHAAITPRDGLAGDSRGRPGRRQVTVLAREAWHAACETLADDLPWTLRRANLLVEGVALAGTATARLRIGLVLLEITMETKPCERMNRQRPGLREALVPDWRGGVCCRVLEGGTVRIGDPVTLDDR